MRPRDRGNARDGRACLLTRTGRRTCTVGVCRLLRVAQDNSQDWQTVKSKNGLVLQKNRRRLFTKDDAPFFRGIFNVQCDPEALIKVRPTAAATAVSSERGAT